MPKTRFAPHLFVRFLQSVPRPCPDLWFVDFVSSKPTDDTETLGFGITFENDFYLLMHTPNRQAEISFLLPNHPSQQPFFHAPFGGEGLYLTIEVDDVDAWHQRLRNQGVPVKVELRDEPWGDRHFAIEDPNGIGIDIVRYAPS